MLEKDRPDAAPVTVAPRRGSLKTVAPAAQGAGQAERPTADRDYLRSITVYLPRSVHKQLKQQAAAGSTTATALILASVNATHDRLGPLLKEQSSPTDTGRRGGSDLFEIPQARAVAEPAVQTTIRVTDAQHQAMVRLVDSYGTNRSQLITVALRLHLASLA